MNLCNLWKKLVPFYLLSDALLDGNFHLTLGGEPGAFKVWSGDSTNSTLLLAITNGNPHFFAAMDAETQVWLEVLKPGPCEITYGFTGEGSAEGISFTDTINITAYGVSLGISNTNLTLLETNVLTVTVFPNSLSASNYVFEISRTNTPLNWYQWHQGEDNVFTNTARTAGHFKVRASVYVNGEKSYSDVEDFEAQFPSWNALTNDIPLMAMFDAMWASTLAATTPTGRREEGCYITLNTTNGEYGKTAHTPGYVVDINSVINIRLVGI